MSATVQTARRSSTRVRQTVGTILIYVGGFGLLAASMTKFAHLPPVVAQLTNVHVRSDEYFACLAPAIFMGVCWLGAWLRHPDVL